MKDSKGKPIVLIARDRQSRPFARQGAQTRLTDRWLDLKAERRPSCVRGQLHLRIRRSGTAPWGRDPLPIDRERHPPCSPTRPQSIDEYSQTIPGCGKLVRALEPDENRSDSIGHGFAPVESIGASSCGRHLCCGLRGGHAIHSVDREIRVRIGGTRAHLASNPYRFHHFLRRGALS